MVDTVLLVTYNRLRGVLDRHAREARATRMNTRAAVENRMEFPRFLSSMLGSIGPLYITDGPTSQLVVYATDADRANTFGRANAVSFRAGPLSRFLTQIRESGIPMAPIDLNNDQGSFFTAVTAVTDHNRWTFTGTCHPSHYENIDVVRSWFCCHPDVNFRPWEYCGFTIGEITNQVAVAAIAAATPEGAAKGLTSADLPAVPIGFEFKINFFGVRPGVAAAGGNPAITSAAYIVGRGGTPYFSTIIGQNISKDEMVNLASYLFTPAETT